MKKALLILMLLSLLLFSCSNKRKQSTAISNYCESLEDSGFMAPMHWGDKDSENDRLLRSCFLSLDGYANGNCDEYPVAMVDSLLDIMALSVSDASMPYRNPFADSLEYYNDRFLVMVYELCPDISLIADHVSDDGQWAVRIYPSPLNSYIFYKDRHGDKRILKNNQVIYTMDSIRNAKPGTYECVKGKPYKFSSMRASGGETKKGHIYFSPFGKFEIEYY